MSFAVPKPVQSIYGWATPPGKAYLSGEDLKISLLAFNKDGILDVKFKFYRQDSSSASGVLEYEEVVSSPSWADDRADYVWSYMFSGSIGTTLSGDGKMYRVLAEIKDNLGNITDTSEWWFWSWMQDKRAYIYVDTVNGSDNGAGTVSSPLKTLKAAADLAISQASNGARIYITDGTSGVYYDSSPTRKEGLAQDKYLEIISPNGLTTIYGASYRGIRWTQIYLSGFTFGFDRSSARLGISPTPEAKAKTVIWADGCFFSGSNPMTEMIHRGWNEVYITDCYSSTYVDFGKNADLVRNSTFEFLGGSELLQNAKTIVHVIGIDSALTKVSSSVPSVMRKVRKDNPSFIQGVRLVELPADAFSHVDSSNTAIVDAAYSVDDNYSYQAGMILQGAARNIHMNYVTLDGDYLHLMHYSQPVENNSIKGCILPPVTFQGSVNITDAVDFQKCHFYSGVLYGGTPTSGDPLFVDPTGVYDFSVASGSPAYQSADAYFSLPPTGTPRAPTSPPDRGAWPDAAVSGNFQGT